MTTGRNRGPRVAFTITELLVAMALIVFLMSIISAAFGAASKAFRDLKSAGDMAAKLRAIMSLLKRDLAARHLDNPPRRLGDGTWFSAMQPTSQGFFRIWQDGQPNYDPPLSPPPPALATSLPSSDTTVTNAGTRLHFTSKLSGWEPGDFYPPQLDKSHSFFTASPAGESYQ